MPWKVINQMDLKNQLIIDLSKEHFSITDLSQKYGISRPTVYKWITRHKKLGVEGLKRRGQSPIRDRGIGEMARKARNNVLYDGCYAHVISRSIRKIRLFEDNEDFNAFKDLLSLVKRRHGFKLYHYCLMQTHFHLAVSMPNVKEFAKALQLLKSQYSYKFHGKYKLSGPIWRERYRALLIENEHYLNACGEYIENNPVKAGVVTKAEDWEHSSSRNYQKGIEDSLIDKYEICIKRGDLESVDFEEGDVIGSSFFRFQFSERMKMR
jgi:putative transposase